MTWTLHATIALKGVVKALFLCVFFCGALNEGSSGEVCYCRAEGMVKFDLSAPFRPKICKEKDTNILSKHNSNTNLKSI